MPIFQKSSFSTAFLNFSPIVVIGSPRSATSEVARILQESLNVMIDEGPIRRDWKNPKGYYEDEKLVAINQRFLKAWRYGTKNSERINLDWAIEFGKWVVNRAAKYERWGFKDPRMVCFINWTFQFLDNPLWIWTIRSDEQIARSQIKKLGYPPAFVKKGISVYKELITKHLSDKNLHRIDLTQRRKESDLIDELRAICGSRLS